MTHRVIPLSALPLAGNSGEPPRDFTLIPRGTLHTVYGDFEWDDESARLTAAAWARRNRRFLWDYEHLSGFTGTNGKPLASVHDRRSAGDAATPIASPDGFKLTDMRWTPDAEKYIRNREFLYYSPVIAVDEKSKPPRIVDVLKSSLTNDPATLGCAPLTLSADEADAVSELATRSAGQERPTLCLDFDGVIHPNEPHDAKLTAPPIEGAKEGVAELRKLARVVIQSARATSPEGQQAVAGYLNSHGIDVDEVTGEKPVAKLYVDDRGLRFTGSWPALIKHAKSGDFKTWEQEMSQHELAGGKLAGPVSHDPDDSNRNASVSLTAPAPPPGSSVDQGLTAPVPPPGSSVDQGLAMPVPPPGSSVDQGLASSTANPALAQGVRPLSGRERKRPHGSRAKKQAVAILVERKGDGHSLWAKRLSSGKYSAPGGFVKKIDKTTGQPERPVDAACRELREETGLACKPSDLRYMGTMRGKHKSGKSIDVHGYKLTAPEGEPQHLAKHEFSHGWEWHKEHPLADAHHSRDALAILSAQHADLRRTMPQAHALNTQSSETTTMSTIIGSTHTMDIQRARSLTSTLLGGLPSLSGDGVKGSVAQAAQAALSAVKALDEALAAAGAGEPADIEQALNLSAVVMDVTGSKDLNGIAGKLYTLADAAKVAPVVLNLSTEQACKLAIDQGISRGAINPVEKARYYDLISRKVLNLSDCQNRANGPKLYDVPNTAPAPVGANNSTVDLSKPAPTAPVAPTAITAAPPATAPQTVELSAQHKQLLADVKRNLPDGMVLDETAVAKVLSAQAAGNVPARMHNPSQPA